MNFYAFIGLLDVFLLHYMCHISVCFVCFASLTAARNIVHRRKSSSRTSHNHKDEDGH